MNAGNSYRNLLIPSDTDRIIEKQVSDSYLYELIGYEKDRTKPKPKTCKNKVRPNT